MRVGIDVSILANRLTGVGYVTLSLIHSLIRLQKKAEWVLLGAPLRMDGLPEGMNFTLHQVGGLTGWRRVVWQQTALPWLASRFGIDVLHCPDFSRPVITRVPVVNTIHDLSYYSPHAYFSLNARTYKRALTRLTVKKSARIVVVSKFTRNELVQRFGLDEAKIPVIYNGVGPFPPGEAAPTWPPYVLHVGTLEERKNLRTLIEGYALMRAQTNYPHRLLLAGKRGNHFQAIKDAVLTSPCAKDIEVLGYVNREKTVELYRGADVLVLPSLHEGFGLPVVEAMALGTPVICSRAASIPEVGGDAAEYFDPLSAEDLASTLGRVLGSSNLRAEMTRKGLDRAKQFSWDECARRYYEVYRSVAPS